jgi:hypothetical protein
LREEFPSEQGQRTQKNQHKTKQKKNLVPAWGKWATQANSSNSLAMVTFVRYAYCSTVDGGSSVVNCFVGKKRGVSWS